MVVIVDGVCICVGFAAPSPEVFATHEASIHIDIGQRNGAHFLEIEVQRSSFYLEQVTADESKQSSSIYRV